MTKAKFLTTGMHQWYPFMTSGTSAGLVYTPPLLTLTNDCSWNAVVKNRDNCTPTNGLIDLWSSFGCIPGQVSVIIWGGLAAGLPTNVTLSMAMYGWRNGPTGPCLPLFASDANGVIVGTAVTTYLPYGPSSLLLNAQWVDTITSAYTWNGVTLADATGTNRVASVNLDVRGLRYLYLGMADIGMLALDYVGAAISGT